MSATVTMVVDGTPVTVPAGITIAAALFAMGRLVLGRRPRADLPRGVFCGMGVCHDCTIVVNGVAGIRACVTQVSDGMRVDLGA